MAEILLYGTLKAILAMLLDNIGTDLMWWGYPTKLFQMFPPLLPADITLVPYLMMLIYQWTHSWTWFLLFNLILSLFMAYIGEPLFIWLDFYELNNWKLVYSFLFYNISGVIFRWNFLINDCNNVFFKESLFTRKTFVWVREKNWSFSVPLWKTYGV